MTAAYETGRTLANGIIALMRHVYRTVVPKKVRTWPAKPLLFVFDHDRYIIEHELRRHYYEEDRSKEDFFRRAFRLLAYNNISGDYLEFGVAWGNTFALAYHRAHGAGHPARLWAFDSFQGLPASDDPRDDHPQWQEGNFAVSLNRFLNRCKTEGIPRNRFEIVQGLFSDSLSPSSPGYDRLPKDIAFAYIDCDMYTSAKSVLNFLAPRLKHGMVVAFDDYFCLSPNALAGERLAFTELQKEVSRFRFVPYIQFGVYGASFIVENLSTVLI